mgnify:CR=1 FL=1
MNNFLKKNRFFLFLAPLFILNSCGFIGDKKVTPDENAVLSGPPLAIPPDFDIDQPQGNVVGFETPDMMQEQSNVIQDFETNEPASLEDQSMYSLEENVIQDFETYDPNISMRNQMLNANIEQRTNSRGKSYLKSKKSLVPSHSYDVDMIRFPNIYRKNETSKSFFSSSVNVFENSMDLKNDQNLSEAEQNLLEEIMIQDEKQ